jgi:DNA-binding transcriptional regulator YiaG
MKNSLTTIYEFSITRVMEHDLNVKDLRSRLGFTQAQLGEAIGVDQSTVSNWEKGVAAPRGPARKMLQQLTEQVPAPAEAEASASS